MLNSFAPKNAPKFSRLVWFALILGSCSTSKVNDPMPEVDLTLVKPDTTQYPSPYPMLSPYVAKFQAHGKTLFYIGVKHAASLEDPTFKTIHQVIQGQPVDAVVVEGIPGLGSWREGQLPESLVKRCDQCEVENYKTCGEPYFAIQEGRKKNAKIFRGEPLEPEVRAEVLKAGFTLQDLLGFYIVRMIPSWKISGEFNQKTAKRLIETRIVFEKKQIGTDIDFNYDRFSKWYSAHMTHPESFVDIEMHDTGEAKSEENTYVQKISHAVGIARDKSIARQIQKALNEVNTVVVVYGSSHYLNSREALEKMMGKPELLKLY